MATPLSASRQPGVLAEFTLFPKLPKELQLMIWRHTCTIPRVVKLDFNSKTKAAWSSTPIPVTLTISREARSEAKKIYKLSFGRIAAGDIAEVVGEIYFNFDVDILYIGSDTTRKQKTLAREMPLDCRRSLCTRELLHKFSDIKLVRNFAMDLENMGNFLRIIHLWKFRYPTIAAQFHDLATNCNSARLMVEDWDTAIVAHVENDPSVHLSDESGPVDPKGILGELKADERLDEAALMALLTKSQAEILRRAREGTAIHWMPSFLTSTRELY